MDSPQSSTASISFCDFPEDVHVAILSFLQPADITALSLTSERFASLCAEDRLWFSMCDRRWGSKTCIRSWVDDGKHRPSFEALYKMLDRWENLIGFWRRIGGRRDRGGSALISFEWGSSFIVGSTLAQSQEPGSCEVVKSPFVWLGLSTRGELLSFTRFARPFEPSASSVLLPATVDLIGPDYFVLEEKQRFRGSKDSAFLHRLTESLGNSAIIEENRPTGRRLKPEQFVKIVDCYPTPQRPLQGIWKGICESMRLAFYLVTYDGTGAIWCRRISDLSESLSGFLPIFWTSQSALVEHPYTREELSIYHSREHISLDSAGTERNVSQIFLTNCSYDLVTVDSFGSTIDYQNVEGRVWLYDTSTFAFGFLRNTHIVDLTHITSC